MSNDSDFVIVGGVLEKYQGPGGDVVIPEGVTSIGWEAFSGCTGLTSVTIPDGVTSIENGAFYGCTSLTSVTIPERVTEIGDYAFGNCTSLTGVTIPEDMTEICWDWNAFYGCISLATYYVSPENKYFTVKDGYLLSKDGQKLIAAPSGLISSTIPDGVTEIGERAFSLCTGLIDVIIPEGVTDIGAYAFDGVEFSKVSLPKSLRNIGISAFAGTKEIEIYDSIDPEAEPADASIDPINGIANSNVGWIGIQHDREYREYTMCAASPDSSWIDHWIIVYSAETGNIKFKVWMCGEHQTREVYCTLASSWGKNATFAFKALDALFPKMKNLSDKIKVSLSRLKYPIELTDGAERMYQNYLKRTGARMIPQLISEGDLESIQSISEYKAFTISNISGFIEASVAANQAEITAFLLNWREKHYSDKEMMRQSERQLQRELISESSVWSVAKRYDGTLRISNYKGPGGDVVVPDEIKGKTVTEIGGKAFKGNTSLTSIALPSTVRKIAPMAFAGCSTLTSVTIPEGVAVIEKGTFGRTGLTNVIIPKSVIAIGENSFAGCYALVNVIFLEEVDEATRYRYHGRRIEKYAFSGCRTLASISIPKGTTEIGAYAFWGCSSLAYVTVPKGVRNIWVDTFSGCTKLSKIVLPNSVNMIQGAFQNCPNLTICAPVGSYAERYAKKKGIPFVAE